MGKRQRVLIDIEKQAGSLIQEIPAKGVRIETVMAGKTVMNTPLLERNTPIYQMLDHSFDISFCTDSVIGDFLFYPIPEFAIFAVDSEGGCMGTIGGCGGLEDDRYAVGYVSGAKGYKVAGSIKDFLEMAIYYPCWREVARCIRQNLPYSITNLLEAYEESHPQTEQDRKQLSKQLSLSHNPRSMDLLAVCLKKQDDFLVYASRQEPEDLNLFRS